MDEMLKEEKINFYSGPDRLSQCVLYEISL